MKQFRNLTHDKTITECSKEAAELIVKVFAEVTKAEAKHPGFAKTLPDALLVISEELGEAQRAYLQYEYEGKNHEEIRKELIQTAATCFRLLLNLDEYVADISLARIESAFSKVAKDALQTDANPYSFQAQAYADIMSGKGFRGFEPGATTYVGTTAEGVKRSFEDMETLALSDPKNDAVHSIAEEIFKDYAWYCLCAKCQAARIEARLRINGGKENAPKGCKPLRTELKPCQPAKQPEPFGGIGEAINRICNPERNGMYRDGNLIGKSRDAIQYAYAKGGKLMFVTPKLNIVVDMRKNRVKYSVTKQSVDDAMQAGILLERWVSANLPTGFKFSHSLGVDCTAITIAKRI